ncbi:MAG: aminoacyl-tRNA hydrolase [Candidatus Binataceae bacterium]|nr:aminoacyl-tRNA hydrolase [Candidatus Binataceae bacterium]
MSPIGRLFRNFRGSKSVERDRAAETADGGEVQWVIAGLGNPGDQYRRSRHNLGFVTLDRIAGKHGVKLSRGRFKSHYARATIAERAAILVKPENFYNLSGDSLAPLLGYFKTPVERLIVIHDDLDLEAGRLRLKRGGGDAGNRGVRSIAEKLGTEFIRIRIGIGRPPGESESKDFVLKPLSSDELRAFDSAIARAAEAVEMLMVEDLDRTMSRFNQRA